MWDLTHIYVWRDSYICVTWLIHMWDVTHTYVGRDSYIFEMCLYPWESAAQSHIFICDIFLCIYNCFFFPHRCINVHYISHIYMSLYITYLYVRHVTDAFACHDTILRETWLFHMWDMPYLYVGRDSYICGTWLVHMWDVTVSLRQSTAWPGKFTRAPCHSHMYVMTQSYARIRLIHLWDMTCLRVGYVCVVIDSYMTRDTCESQQRSLSFVRPVTDIYMYI